MDVKDVMLTNVAVVPPSASLRQVATILSLNGGNAVLVVDDDGEVLGLVSESVLAGVVDRISDARELEGADHPEGARLRALA